MDTSGIGAHAESSRNTGGGTVLRRRVRRMISGRRERNRMRSSRWRRGRVLLRSRHHRLVYAGRWPLAAIAIALCVGVAAAAAIAGPPTIVTASALVIA